MTFKYKLGGTISPNSEVYIERRADEQLYQLLLDGELCHVLASRQMGKSSLKARTQMRLEQDGVRCCAIDLSKAAKDNTVDSWYRGLCEEFATGLGLSKLVVEGFLCECENLSPSQWLQNLVDEILLPCIKEDIVIFIDEIDSTIGLKFNTDSFFTWIRYCHNHKSEDPNYSRLTFCLLGVAKPEDLIKDKTRTPFNVGTSVELQRFSEEEIEPLMKGIEKQCSEADRVKVCHEIHQWTGGQPFLTQRLCELIQSKLHPIKFGQEVDEIAQLVESQIVENWQGNDPNVHLSTIQVRLLDNRHEAVRVLGIYQQVLQRVLLKPYKPSGDDLSEVITLQLAGLTILEQGQLLPYNKIYQRVFDEDWVIRELASLRPYAGSLAQWLESGEDAQYLLTGDVLLAARQWAGEQRLMDEDYRYLTASEGLNTKEAIEQAHTAEARARQITKIAKRNALVFTTTGMIFLIGAAITAGLAWLKFDQVTWLARLEKSNSDAISQFPVSSLERLVAVMKVGQELRKKVANVHINDYPSYTPLVSLQQALTTNWYEANYLTDYESADGITSAAISANGQFIVSGGGDLLSSLDLKGKKDHLVRIWKHDGSLLSSFISEKSSIHYIAASKDGKTIVTNGWGGATKIWHMNKFLDQSRVITLSDRVSNIRISADGQTVVYYIRDEIKVRRSDGSLIARISNKLSPNDSLSVSADGRIVVFGTNDGRVKMWKRGGSIVTILTPDSTNRLSVKLAISADGKSIVSGDDDGKVSVWRQDGSLAKTLIGHKKFVNSIAVSADGKTIAAGSYFDNTVKIWDENGSLMDTIEAHGLLVSNISISGDGKTIVLAGYDGKARIWKRNTSLRTTLNQAVDSYDEAVAITDAQIVVSGSGEKVKLWRKDGSLLGTFIGCQESIHNMAVSGDGQTIVVNCVGDTIKIWRQDGSLINTLVGHKSVGSMAVSFDGQIIVSGGRDGTIKMWRRDGSLIKTLIGHKDDILSIVISSDGQTIVSGSHDSTIKVWKRDGSLVNTLVGHKGLVRSVAVSSDGQTIVSGSHQDHTIKVWKRDGSLITSITDNVFRVAVSGDGQTIISGNTDRTIKVWRKNGSLISTFTGYENPVDSIAISANAQIIVSTLQHNDSAKIQHLDLEWLLAKGCDRLKDYLKSHPDENKEGLCPK